MKLPIIFSLTLFIPLISGAKTQPKAEADLKQLALLEIQEAKPKSNASDQASVRSDSLLQLTDHYKSPSASDFNWLASVEFSTFKTSGTKYLGGGALQKIDDRNNTIPRVAFGTRYNLIKAGPQVSSWFVGLDLGIAFSTDLQKVQFASRQVEAYLNHTLVDLGLKTSIAFAELPRLSFGYAFSWGQASSTQTASESIADWTELTPYRQSTLSAEYDFSRGWFGTLSFGQRENAEAGKALDMAQTQWRSGLGFIW